MNSEDRVFSILKRARGPMSAASIAKAAAIQHNTCIKDIKFLRDRGVKIKGRMVSGSNVFGDQVSYKVYWI